MTEPRGRTVLEEQIRARRMTFEEFVGYAEKFAREHGEPGTLSLRHLNRLASGSHTGASRPATKRLLEAIFGQPWEQLLASPDEEEPSGHAEDLVARLRDARRVDAEAVRLLAGQVDTIRELDRRFGGGALLDQLLAHAALVQDLLAYAVNEKIRRALALILVDAYTLAGWQTLDRGEALASWKHYGSACEAARIAEAPIWLAHAQAEQAVVLSDVGETALAVEMTQQACESARRSAPALLRCWLAAAHGEALAADGQSLASLRAFDKAQSAMPADGAPESRSPYLALDEVHLARWRGHALVRLGHPEAVTVLTEVLAKHDPTFVRAETALRTDLARAYTADGEQEAAAHQRVHALRLAEGVGSVRQRRRLSRLR